MNKKNARRTWSPAGLILSLAAAVALTGCGGDDAEEPAPPADTAAATATPTEQAVADTGPSDADLAISALVAIDMIDGAGFHDMAKELAEATEVNPRFAGKVANSNAVVQRTEWDDSLQALATALQDELTAFEAALRAGDLETSRTIAEAVHDAQHDLSVETYAYLAKARPVGADDGDASLVSLIAAIDVIDSGGFHDMAKTLAEATEVNPRFAGTTEKALTAAKLAGWGSDLRAEGERVTADLNALLVALKSEDVKASAEAAEAVHDSQHDASKATYAWLATNHPGMSHASDVLATACSFKAVDAVDSVGFHDMAKELAEATEINPRYAGKVANALAVVSFDAGSDAEGLNHMSEVMTELHEALVAGDLEAARQLAEEVHDAQHDFSNEMYGMMAKHGS